MVKILVGILSSNTSRISTWGEMGISQKLHYLMLNYFPHRGGGSIGARNIHAHVRSTGDIVTCPYTWCTALFHTSQNSYIFYINYNHFQNIISLIFVLKISYQHHSNPFFYTNSNATVAYNMLHIICCIY